MNNENTSADNAKVLTHAIDNAIRAQKEARLARSIAVAAAQRASELEDAAAVALSISRAIAACVKNNN